MCHSVSGAEWHCQSQRLHRKSIIGVANSPFYFGIFAEYNFRNIIFLNKLLIIFICSCHLSAEEKFMNFAFTKHFIKHWANLVCSTKAPKKVLVKPSLLTQVKKSQQRKNFFTLPIIYACPAGNVIQSGCR